jgi:uncharacterized RDD family membrane protein YckC
MAQGSTRMVTPEAVALEFQTANVGSRILAFLVDMAVVAAGLFVGITGVVLLVSRSALVLPEWLVLAMFFVLVPGWWLGYFIAFETLWRGRTLGKAALGLRVVTREGAPVRFRHATIRTLLGTVDFLLSSGFFAVVFILFSRDNQRLGDMVAGTLVLRERRATRLAAPVSFASPPGLEAYTDTLDVTGVATEDYQAVRSFLLRAEQFAPAARASLAAQLATPLAARLRPPPPDGVPPEAYLRCVAAAYQRRQRAAGGIPQPPPGGRQPPARPAPGPSPPPGPAVPAGPGAGSVTPPRSGSDDVTVEVPVEQAPAAQPGGFSPPS